MTTSLFMRIRACFPGNLDKTLIEAPDGNCLTYRDADEWSARYANALVQAGAQKGDRIAVQVEKSPAALFLYLGCIRAGLVYLPLNTAYQAHELSYFIEDASPAVIVCQPSGKADMDTIVQGHDGCAVFTLDGDGRGSIVDAAASQVDDFTPVACADDDLAAILYTSGTTGKPKGAMMTQMNLWSNGQTLVDLWGFTASDTLLHALPIFHTHGLFIACHCVLMSGADMIFLPKFDRDQVIKALPRATVMMGVPTFYVRLLAGEDFSASLVSNMRLFISGSAPLLPETFSAFHQRTGHYLLERYGMTEMGMATSNPLHGERIIHTVGPALPDVEVRVCDADGNVLPKGEVGVLEARGPNVFPVIGRCRKKHARSFAMMVFLLPAISR
ncbi:AMP-binding protein [Thalassospira profundimaris]|uniref:AMP-binding protein n=1 Tax=Thalassospira profundimaris TaxID=502049 RepID=UPI00268C3644